MGVCDGDSDSDSDNNSDSSREGGGAGAGRPGERTGERTGRSLGRVVVDRQRAGRAGWVGKRGDDGRAEQARFLLLNAQ